jgi:hypothetical protein
MSDSADPRSAPVLPGTWLTWLSGATPEDVMMTLAEDGSTLACVQSELAALQQQVDTLTQERDEQAEMLKGVAVVVEQHRTAHAALLVALRAKIDDIKRVEAEFREDFRKFARKDPNRANTSNAVADGYSGARRLLAALLDPVEGTPLRSGAEKDTKTLTRAGDAGDSHG